MSVALLHRGCRAECTESGNALVARSADLAVAEFEDGTGIEHDDVEHGDDVHLLDSGPRPYERLLRVSTGPMER